MKLKLHFHFLFAVSLLMFSAGQSFLHAQARLVIGTTSAVYMNINGGSLATPIYLVIDNGASNAIWAQPAAATFPTSGAGTSWIISEGQYNYVKWRSAANGSTYTIPFGIVSAPSTYLPVTLRKTAGPATDDLLASTWGTPNTNVPWASTTDVAAVTPGTGMQNSLVADASIGYVIDRWWTINFSLNSSTADQLSFTYRGSENTMNTPTDGLAVQHWDGSKWNDGNGGGNGTNVNTGAIGSNVAGPHTVTTGGAAYTQFSPYILVSQPHPLPVTWLDISAACNHGAMTIKWSTASEQNSNFFTVERSQDGTNFSAIATKTAAGSSSTVKNYSAVDTDPYSGTSFYRISETDFNGDISYSSIISVTGCSDDDVTVYGSGGDVAININATKDGQYSVELYDMLGQKIMNEVKNVTTGTNYLKLSPGNIAGAIYVVKVYNSTNAVTKKVFIR